MPSTYEPIATTTLGSSANTITFSSIPSTYTDFRIVLAGVTESYPSFRLNSDTGSNYSLTELNGDGAGASSNRSTSATRIYLGSQYGGTGLTNPQLLTLDVFSYAGSTFKTCLITASKDQNGAGYVTRSVGLWRNTSAITSITFTAEFGSTNFAAGFTATLYGIKNA